MVAFLRMRLPRLASPADADKPLALPPRAFCALVAFLRRCRAEERAAGSGVSAGGDGDVNMLSGAPGELPAGYLGAVPDAQVPVTGRRVAQLSVQLCHLSAAGAVHAWEALQEGRIAPEHQRTLLQACWSMCEGHSN